MGKWCALLLLCAKVVPVEPSCCGVVPVDSAAMSAWPRGSNAAGTGSAGTGPPALVLVLAPAEVQMLHKNGAEAELVAALHLEQARCRVVLLTLLMALPVGLLIQAEGSGQSHRGRNNNRATQGDAAAASVVSTHPGGRSWVDAGDMLDTAAWA